MSGKKTNQKKSTSYASAGVSIDAGNKLVDKIKPFVKATKRTGADVEIGGFGGLFDLAKCKYNDPILVSGTDGVGTKLKIAQELDIHDTIGIDLVAMCVNDIIVQGAEPLFFLDYFACGKLEVNTASKVVKGIAEGCKQAGAALIGGETAEMPGMYKEGEYDLAGFSVGAVERSEILPKKGIKEGDILIGLASSGIHSNGYSLVRKVLADNKIKFSDKPKGFRKAIGKVLLEPTKIYVEALLELIKKHNIKALSHITGGGLTENLPRVLPKNLGAEITVNSWKKPKIFEYIKQLGNIEESEMLRTFNYGIGMVLVIDKADEKKVTSKLIKLGEEFAVIGKITKGNGIKYN